MIASLPTRGGTEIVKIKRRGRRKRIRAPSTEKRTDDSPSWRISTQKKDDNQHGAAVNTDCTGTPEIRDISKNATLEWSASASAALRTGPPAPERSQCRTAKCASMFSQRTFGRQSSGGSSILTSRPSRVSANSVQASGRPPNKDTSRSGRHTGKAKRRARPFPS